MSLCSCSACCLGNFFLFVKNTNLDLLQVDVLIMLRHVIIMGTKCSVFVFLVSTLIEPFAKLQLIP